MDLHDRGFSARAIHEQTGRELAFVRGIITRFNVSGTNRTETSIRNATRALAEAIARTGKVWAS